MTSEKYDYDAIVVGSGPNGLAAAILLQQQGLSVLILEGKDVIGGGLTSAQLTLPGFTHDVCSAIHPLAVTSPFFKTLPLAQHGLEYIQPTLAAAHPFDDGTAAETIANNPAFYVEKLGFAKNSKKLVEDGWGKKFTIKVYFNNKYLLITAIHNNEFSLF